MARSVAILERSADQRRRRLTVAGLDLTPMRVGMPAADEVSDNPTDDEGADAEPQEVVHLAALSFGPSV
jgi:hypothetical protein